MTSVMSKSPSTYPSVEQAYAQAMRKRVLAALGAPGADAPLDEYATLLAELVTWDALGNSVADATKYKQAARAAFTLLRDAGPEGADRANEVAWWLRTSCLAVIADLPQEAKKLLEAAELSVKGEPGAQWLDFTRETVWTSWLGLVRQRSLSDVESAQGAVERLRTLQRTHEAVFLKRFEDQRAARDVALELMALYFLGTAAEKLSQYLIKGTADGGADIGAQLDMYFDRIMHALDRVLGGADLDIALLLRPAAQNLIDSSLRAATRGANSLTRKFAEVLIERDVRPLFQLLPPQRMALREQGLIASAHRSVVVNFPTSSGKTLLAQFSVLQALNDLGQERGWVAYVAPTRALVNQVTKRLRGDFESLGKRVERLSPALEFDTGELSALAPVDRDVDGPPVDVLICTPEKLDLLMRREDLCKQLGRLALVVVDEAHGIGGKSDRAIKLELLLSMINREHEGARFLLLTPFIKNAKRVAEWLDQKNSRDYSIGADWVPNDRIVGILSPPEKPPKSRGVKPDHVLFEPKVTPKHTLHIDDVLKLEGVAPELGFTYAKLHASLSNLSTAASQVLSRRGPTVLLCRTVKQTWNCAADLTQAAWPELDGAEDRATIARFASYELGASAPLANLLEHGVGVHHAGLPEELAQSIEWLFENRRLHALCATTTLAQGVNFPIANLVLSSIYPATRDGQAMSYSDFWNIAGRVGRVDQDFVGVVALASTDIDTKQKCEHFLQRSMTDLVSNLVDMVGELGSLADDHGLEKLVWKKEWSNFSQFIAHTLRQVGVERFADQVELILRGTFGYQTLREQNSPLARELLVKTRQYANKIASDMGAVALVDSTGFSFESVRSALFELGQVGNLDDMLDPKRLFSGKSNALREVMGVLLNIPEVRKELVEDGGGGSGSRIAEMLSDWVHGMSVESLADRYFKNTSDDEDNVTQCVKKFRRLSMTSAWGLSSVLAMRFGKQIEAMDPFSRQAVTNIPSMVLYGVSTPGQIALRAAGVPRNAALAMATDSDAPATPYAVRKKLKEGGGKVWTAALGQQRGADYFRVWQILESE